MGAYSNKVKTVEVFPSAARTSTVSSEGSALAENFDQALIMVDISAVSGTPTLNMRYQVSPDDGVTWFTREAMPEVTAVGQSVLLVAGGTGQQFRLQAVIGGGSPSLTFRCWVTFKGM